MSANATLLTRNPRNGEEPMRPSTMRYRATHPGRRERSLIARGLSMHRPSTSPTLTRCAKANASCEHFAKTLAAVSAAAAMACSKFPGPRPGAQLESFIAETENGHRLSAKMLFYRAMLPTRFASGKRAKLNNCCSSGHARVPRC
jgi:hypothetical protein